MSEVIYRAKPPLSNAELNVLYGSAWPHHVDCDCKRGLDLCLTFFGAYSPEGALIGFVKVAWDGDIHAFLLDPTVHPNWQRRGIGKELVRLATEAAREQGLEWLHVDYQDHLEHFYAECGFRPTLAGLIKLDSVTSS